MTESLGRILRETPQDQRLEPLVHVRTARRLSRRHGRLREVLAHELAERATAEQRLTAEQLVHDRAERVDVAALIDRHAAGLLGRHVRGRADHRAGRGLKADVLVVAVDQLGDTEVEQLDQLAAIRGRRDHDVVGLEIAVDHADGVRGAEPIADLHEHRERARQIDPAARPLAEAAPRQQLHDDERRAVGQLDEVGDVDDVAMADAVDRLGFLEEAIDGVAPARVVGAQELQRDLSAELDVLGAKHVAHAALAEQLEQAIRAEHASDALVGIVGVVRNRRWLRRLARRQLGLAAARRLDARALVAGAGRE